VTGRARRHANNRYPEDLIGADGCIAAESVYSLRMGVYLRIPPIGEYLELWEIASDVAVQIGISNPERGAGTYFKADPGETIWDALRRQTPWFPQDSTGPFHKAELEPGRYYPRMARPPHFRRNDTPGISPGAQHEVNLISIARSQLAVLARQLNRICQTVHPTQQTFETFGHDIRNLQWRGVLGANGVKKRTCSTRDYVRLQPAMKLDEYAVRFPYYPWLEAIQPYKGWGSTENPTQDLKWYDAYNAVKHNREAEFERATLRHAFEAVSGCFIMITAQFGDEGIERKSEIDSFFKFSALPKWSPSNVYILPGDAMIPDWSPTFFDFGGRSAPSS
jgi:hypothetical protein